MNRIAIFIVLALSPSVAVAQMAAAATAGRGSLMLSPFADSAGWWPGYVGGQTPAGAALNGLASVISAEGDYNLSSSAAAINLTQAEKNEIQNQQLGANTYFEMRAAWRAQRDAQHGPPPTVEQIARLAHYGVPRALTPDEFDSVSGRLNWPSALQQESFASDRAAIEQFFVTWSQEGGLSYVEQTKLREAINAMYDDLNAQINSLPPPVWAECRRFLRSLIYAATKADLG
jgi:hypothetical protein